MAEELPVETSTADAAKKELTPGEMFAEVQEATGIDIQGLISSFTEGNAADEAFRAEVMERFEVLIKNQELIYAYLTRDTGPLRT